MAIFSLSATGIILVVIQTTCYAGLASSSSLYSLQRERVG